MNRPPRNHQPLKPPAGTAPQPRPWAAAFRAAALVFLVLAAGSAVSPVRAAENEKKTMTFRGVKVTPFKGEYVVLRDVNVRAKPKTKSKKVGSLKAGRRVQVVAKAPGAWMAVRDGTKDLGFVYSPMLMPLIDGALAEDLTGNASVKGGAACDYRIRFEGKSQVEGQVFEIADYDVMWDCKVGKRRVRFRTPMFITEAPYQLGSKRIYQINVDVLDLYGGYEDIFSTVVLYDKDKDQVTFDGVSIKKYGQTPKEKTLKAGTVPEALTGAVKMALAAWNKSAWKDLIKNMPEEKEPDKNAKAAPGASPAAPAAPKGPFIKAP